MEKIKLGIIGCGIAANDLHYPALRQLEDKFEVRLVCNHTEPKAQKLAKKFGGIPYVIDYHDLLQNKAIDAVDIALPIELNHQVTRDAVKAGKHVIVEKPLTKNLKQGRKLVNIESQTDLLTLTAENFHYKPVYQKAGELIEENLIGNVSIVRWNIFNNLRPDNKYYKTRWRREHKHPGGYITDGGVHFIAGIREIFDDYRFVSSVKKSINPAIGNVDTLFIQFSAEKGILGNLNISYSTNSYSNQKLVINGTKGSIIIEGNHLKLFQENVLTEEFDFSNQNGYKLEFEDFYEAIINNGKVKCPFRESYKDLAIIIEALNKAKTI